MIDIHDISHVWECSPAITYNEGGELKIKIKLASLPERRKKHIEQMNVGPEAIQKATDEFVSARVVSIEGLMIGGKEITTYDELLATGTYNELVGWCVMAVENEALLDLAEIKNSSPESATASTAG